MCEACGYKILVSLHTALNFPTDALAQSAVHLTFQFLFNTLNISVGFNLQSEIKAGSKTCEGTPRHRPDQSLLVF